MPVRVVSVSRALGLERSTSRMHAALLRKQTGTFVPGFSHPIRLLDTNGLRLSVESQEATIRA